MDTLHTTLSQQNRLAAAAQIAPEELTSGDLYLAALNIGTEATLSQAAARHEHRTVAFSTGNGACRVREF